MSSRGGRLSRRERKLANEKARRAVEVQRRKLRLVASSKDEVSASIPEASALMSDGTTGLPLAPSHAAADDAVSVEAAAQPISERHLRAAAVYREDLLTSLARFLEALDADDENDAAAVITDARPRQRSRPDAVFAPEIGGERAALLAAVERYLARARELRIHDRFTSAVRNAESELWQLHQQAGVPSFTRSATVAPFSYDRQSWAIELRDQATQNMEFTRALESVLREQIRDATAARRRFARRLWASRFSAEPARETLDGYTLGETELKEAHRELARLCVLTQPPKRFYLYHAYWDGSAQIFEEATAEGALAWQTMRRRLLLGQSYLTRVLQHMFGM